MFLGEIGFDIGGREMSGSLFSMGQVNSFYSPNKILLGIGAAKQIGKEARFLDGRKALIVTDPGVVKAGLVESIKESLISENVEVGIFDKVELEPPARVIDDCGRIAREDGYNIIVGLGGGSSLDTAKGASIIATNKGKVLDYTGMDLVPQRGLPKIFLPTTGSGSEVTRVFAPTDERDNTKKVVYSIFNLADVIIADPLLTISLPPDITADTGVDALVGAIEAYVSVCATPFSDILALDAIRLISENLPTAYAKGDHISARLNMTLAAILANLAWQSGGLGAVHALSYVLETECHMRHARAASIMLPHVMEYNKIGNLVKYGQIAKAMRENIKGLTHYEAAERSVSAVKRLLEAVNISFRLSDYGVSKGDLLRLVEGAMRQARLFVPNPRNLTEEDVSNIYSKAI
jgi:alcohol dehydrogenase class IV